MLDGTLGCDDIREGQHGEIIVFDDGLTWASSGQKPTPRADHPSAFVVACRLMARQGLTLSLQLSATACRSRQLCHPT
jgi:hypothetical protein